MAMQVDDVKTFNAAGTISQYAWVKLDSNGAVVACTLGDRECIGTAQSDATSGNPVSVRLITPGKSFKSLAEGVMSAGNTSGILTYNGKVSVNCISGMDCLKTGNMALFTVLETSTGAGVIEVLPKMFRVNY